jgi:hypothetical protein
MKTMNSHFPHWNNILKDAAVLISLFLIFYFIDLQLAFFISAISLYLLMIRRVILILNPGFIKGYRINYKGRQLSIPNGVDIFTLDETHSVEALHRYAEIIRSITTPPEVIIVRFNKIKRLMQPEADILMKFINQTKTYKMKIIFSDVNTILQDKFRESTIELMVGGNNIFYYISDALTHANEILNANSLVQSHLFNPLL